MTAPASPSGDVNYTSNDHPRQGSNEPAEASALMPETYNGGRNDKGQSRESPGGTVKDQQSNSNKRDESEHLDVPLTNSFRPSTDSMFSDPSLYPGHLAESRFDDRPLLRSPSPAGPPLESRPSTPPLTWRGKLWAAWLQSKGLVLVMLSQFFGASMNVMTRVLEINGPHGKGMHPFQVSGSLDVAPLCTYSERALMSMYCTDSLCPHVHNSSCKLLVHVVCKGASPFWHS